MDITNKQRLKNVTQYGMEEGWGGESRVHKYPGDGAICIFGRGAVSLSKIRREVERRYISFEREMKENLFFFMLFIRELILRFDGTKTLISIGTTR